MGHEPENRFDEEQRPRHEGNKDHFRDENRGGSQQPGNQHDRNEKKYPGKEDEYKDKKRKAG